jgi:hypothetical protein
LSARGAVDDAAGAVCATLLARWAWDVVAVTTSSEQPRSIGDGRI